MRILRPLLAMLLATLFLLALGACNAPNPFNSSILPTPRPMFNGDQAYRHVLAQVGFGARPTGSNASRKTGDYIINQLKSFGWQVETQEFDYMGVKARNIIGKQGRGPITILGAHYDTRRQADNDPDPTQRTQPVMGADDGASGVAVLLELARTLDVPKTQREIWLAFFDAEDDGRLEGWDWIIGSTRLADSLTVTPTAMILLDMIGDADQQLYWDHNSDQTLNESIWQVAASIGYTQTFIPQYKWTMIDDHIPFARHGIPAIDLIDFDYPYWHTTHDTADKVSPISLERIGRTLAAWLERTAKEIAP